jgi:hypothetical protein
MARVRDPFHRDKLIIGLLLVEQKFDLSLKVLNDGESPGSIPEKE